jgi:hypothetical protein
MDDIATMFQYGHRKWQLLECIFQTYISWKEERSPYCTYVDDTLLLLLLLMTIMMTMTISLRGVN